MARALVIVESPAKAKTINKFLGKAYQVEPSMGHVRDLPKNEIAVDEEHGYAPTYVLIEDRKKVVDKLVKVARKVDRIIVATDPDREGEAIGWHLVEVLREHGADKPVERVAFNEITKRAVLEALEHPTQIDARRVEAQQARRILDRIVGYKLSPLLWDKIRRGLSAGRVQSVALRLVCDREKEIDAFEPQEYWVVGAQLEGREPPPFVAKLKKRRGEDYTVRSGEQMEVLRSDLDGATWKVSDIERKERKRKPAPPFTTSKFQQAASRNLRMPVRIAMRTAQSLYEGKSIGSRGQVGLITYMRTDSTRVSDAALADARQVIETKHGKEYLPEKAIQYKSKKGAQDAHEAIRPTYLDLPPQEVASSLSKDELAVYTMIWNRFVASQMKPALFDETIVSVEAADHVFEARGSVMTFPGFLAVYRMPSEDEDPEKDADSAEEEGNFPRLSVGETLKLVELDGEQKFTQHPPRFSEATLVKALEENGIGRPSTYASILNTLRQRDYTTVTEQRFHPTSLGRVVVDDLQDFFEMMAIDYTARMEADLDDIEEGRRDWVEALGTFNEAFGRELAKAKEEMPDRKGGVPTGKPCPDCEKGQEVRKFGRFGPFLTCDQYPECDYSKDELEEEYPDFDIDCPECFETKLQVRRGRFGEFLACPRYPDCKGTARLRKKKDGTLEPLVDVKLDEHCPECERQLVEREGRFGKFVSCTGYPECTYIKQEKTGHHCPQPGCPGELVVKPTRRGKPFYGCNAYPDCEYIAWDRPIDGTCPTCKAPFVLEKETKKYGTYKYCFREECEWTDAPEGAPKPRKASATSGRARKKAAAKRKTKASGGAKKKTRKKGSTRKGSSKKRSAKASAKSASSKSSE